MLVMAVSSRWLGRDGTRAGRADSTVIGLGDRLVSGHVRPAGVPMVAAAGADRSRTRHQAGGGRGQALAATTTGRSSQWWENEAPTTRAACGPCQVTRLVGLVLLQATFACPCRDGCLRLDSQLRRGEQRQWTSLTE